MASALDSAVAPKLDREELFREEREALLLDIGTVRFRFE